MPSANSYDSPGTTGGNREGLLDILTVLEPEATPVTSMIAKGSGLKTTYPEWMADNLRKPRTKGTPEGSDAKNFSNKAANRRRFGNYIHRWMDEFAVTDVQQLVEVAGVTDEWNHSKAKAFSEGKRDIEATICGAQEMVQGNGEEGWVTRGLFEWIKATAQATNPVPELYRTPAASIGTKGEDTEEEDVVGILQSLFTVYGEKRTYQFPCGVDIIKKVDSWQHRVHDAQSATYQVIENATTKRITLSVVIFDTTFGLCNFIPDQFLNMTDGDETGDSEAALILNPDLLDLHFMENLNAKKLADEGGGDRGYTKAIGALRVNNPRGLGKITAS